MAEGIYLRDYTHASKVFRQNAYANAPKHKFLFHVAFKINPAAYTTRENFGLAVKTAKLPSFTLTTHEMNQYNRKRIVQTKIKYDPVDITFHDDNGDMIRDLWMKYYQYHFSDSTKPDIRFGSEQVNQGSASPTDFNERTLYDDSISGDEDWGFRGESATGLSKTPFFKTINVFGFNQGFYEVYVLVNPIITRFGHDTYSYAEGNGTMENTMTIDYETVVYHSGPIDRQSPEEIITGFGNIASYDLTESPNLSNPGSSIYMGTAPPQRQPQQSPQGFIPATGEASLMRNADISPVTRADVINDITAAMQESPNRSMSFQFPTNLASPNSISQNFLTNPPQIV